MARTLFLTSDADVMRAQVEGRTVDPSTFALAEGVSTDAIIHAEACTLGTTPDVLGPHFLEHFGVPCGSVQAGGFDTVVAGRAYGCGSSREVAVDAHLGAGIRRVFAASVARIFRENAVYRGLAVSTDPELLKQHLAGRPPSDGEMDAELPPLFAEIRRAGGLLAYSARGPEWRAPPGRTRGLTLTEKLIARAQLHGDGGCPEVGAQTLLRVGARGLHEYTAGMVYDLYRAAFSDTPVHAPQSVHVFQDHFPLLGSAPVEIRGRRAGPAARLTARAAEAAASWGAELWDPEAGICHRIALEHFAQPGEVLVMTDSHTPTSGVLGCLAFGVGSAAMACALRHGWVPVTVPRSLKVEVVGDPGPWVSPKDLILHLMGDLRDEGWKQAPDDVGVAEFMGDGLDAWNLDELSVLTNMTVEGGLMTGVVGETEAGRGFLARRNRSGAWLRADDDANWAWTRRIDLGALPLTVAAPGDPRAREPLSAHEGTPVHNVVVASCTGAALPDLEATARALRGQRVAEGVRMTVSPASAEVAEQAAAGGVLAALREAGAHVTAPGCGACIGNGPGAPRPGETTVSTTNRNFDRRMGAPGPVWLASPGVAGASARVGALADPRR